MSLDLDRKTESRKVAANQNPHWFRLSVLLTTSASFDWLFCFLLFSQDLNPPSQNKMPGVVLYLCEAIIK